MRKFILLLMVLGITQYSIVNAQAPNSIPYQAVARDNAGNLISNQNISLRFSIHDVTEGGTIVYRETQNKTTNMLGLFTANIGQGTVISGVFDSVNWSSGAKFMQVELDVTGGAAYADMGTQQLLSVPYALNAANGNWTKKANDIYNSNIGKVGIGTSIPTQMLDVNGTTKTTGLQIPTGAESGRILKSDANGIASWGSIDAVGLFGTPPATNACPVLTGSAFVGSYPSDVVVSGGYAYVLTQGNNLEIFNLSTPTVPVNIGSKHTDDAPSCIAIYGNYAYVTNEFSNNMQIFNISNPALPQLKSSIVTGTAPMSVAVSGNYAYVINNGSTSMKVINIINPAVPVIVGSVFTASGPRSIALSGNYCYVTNDNGNSMQVINITNPVSPVVSATLNLSSPYALKISGNFAYVMTASGIMKIVNISNPNAPVEVGSVATGLTSITGFEISGNYAYFTNTSMIKVFNISDPAAPVIAESVNTPGSTPTSICVSGNYAYVTCFTSDDLKVFLLSCSQNFTTSYNPSTGQVTPLQLQWNTSGNTINNVNSGNVGIGTTTPGKKLDVNGNVRLFDHLIFNSANGVINWGSSGNLYFRTNATQGDESTFNTQMTLSNQGFLGINTAALPTSPLQIDEPFNLSGIPLVNIRQVTSSWGSAATFNNYRFIQTNYAGPASEFKQFNVGGGGVSIGYSTVPVYSSNDALYVNGNVGIGTTNAASAKLVIKGTIASQGIDLSSSDQYANLRVIQNTNFSGDKDLHLGYQSGPISSLHLYSNNSETVTVKEGRVGIGTINPVYPLDVNGSVSDVMYTGYFIQSNGPISITSNPYTSIRTSGTVMAPTFFAISDARTKSVIGVSNSQNDLSLLNKIKVTDYTYIDKLVNGNQVHKKVIAQELENVLPSAVNTSTNFVPDIYALATSVEMYYDQLNFNLPKNCNIKAGDKIKWIDDAGKEHQSFVENTNGVSSFTICYDGIAVDNAFIYGKEVTDFRTVDYEAISMLNVSATQELYKMMLDLKNENEKLKTEIQNQNSLNTSQNKSIEALTKDIEGIKAQMGMSLQTKN